MLLTIASIWAAWRFSPNAGKTYREDGPQRASGKRPQIVFGLVVTACGGDGGATTGPDLDVERQVGYAVIVEQRADGLSIGFSTDRDAEAGDEYDVSESIWRIEDGPWIEPVGSVC